MTKFCQCMCWTLLLSISMAYAGCGKPKEYVGCCAQMGGISYCDNSGRFVCNNGRFSACYCNRHAVMDMQQFEGCCLWQGGVLVVDPTGLVICANGSVSEWCSQQPQHQPYSALE